MYTSDVLLFQIERFYGSHHFSKVYQMNSDQVSITLQLHQIVSIAPKIYSRHTKT
jgi:hypothetical protein